MTAQDHHKPKLFDRVREAVRIRHYSIGTERAYVDWIRRYILFHDKKHPAALEARHVGEFLSYLAQKRNVAASTQNQALCAIVFLYRNVLEIELGAIGNIVFAKKPHRLPEVFSKDEVRLVLKQIKGWQQYVFPSKSLSIDPRSGERRRHHVHRYTVQRAIRNAVRQAGLTKKGQKPYPAPLLCDASAGRRLRHPHGSGVAGPQGRTHDPDLYPCPEPRRHQCRQPG